MRRTELPLKNRFSLAGPRQKLLLLAALVVVCLAANQASQAADSKQRVTPDCDHRSYPKLIAALRPFDVLVTPTTVGSTSSRGGSEKFQCGVDLSWARKPEKLHECLEQVDLVYKVFAWQQDRDAEGAEGAAFAELNCDNFRWPNPQPPSYEKIRKHAVFWTRRGGGPYSEMTYATFRSAAEFRLENNSTVTAIAPAVTLCNGECSVETVIIDENGTTVGNADWHMRAHSEPADVSDAEADFKRPLTLEAKKTYTIFFTARSTKAIGIETTGLEARVADPHALHVLFVDTGFNSQPDRGSLSFTLFGSAN